MKVTRFLEILMIPVLKFFLSKMNSKVLKSFTDSSTPQFTGALLIANILKITVLINESDDRVLNTFEALSVCLSPLVAIEQRSICKLRLYLSGTSHAGNALHLT